MDFGKRFQREREKLNMSQLELSKKVDINNSVLSRIEAGDRPARTDEILKIANALNVSADYLLGNSQSPTLTQKDELDIAKRIEALEADLENHDNLMMHGEILDDETRELVKASLAIAVRMSKIAAKEKFTPKKYKK